MMGNKEAVKAILEGKPVDRIPVIHNIMTLSAVRYGYSVPEILMDPNKYVECVLGTKNKLGYDGVMSGGAMITMDLAGHLPNAEGRISMDGADTVHCLEDIEKLNFFEIDQSMVLKGLFANIAMINEMEPDTPHYVAMYPPTGIAFDLIGAKLAFKSMVKNPEFFKGVAKALEDIEFEVAKAVWDAGVDYLWFPEPNFGGACISRKTYERCISESNIRFFNRLHDAGIKFIIHTCGPYDDRFDLVLKEKANGWHLSDTITANVVEKYGDQVALMGNIPCVPVLFEGTPESVYDFTYNDCKVGSKYGRFICAGDCDLAPPTSDENIIASVKAAKDVEKELYG